MELICGGLIFIVLLIFALSKASEAAKGVDDLKRTVQRLEGGLDRILVRGIHMFGDAPLV